MDPVFPLVTLVEHWDGSAWSIVLGPDLETYSSLTGVVAVAPNDVWAVGDSATHVLVEHWDGGAWSVVPSPGLGYGDSTLSGITATGEGDLWATGSYSGGPPQPHRTLVERYSACTPTSCTLQFTDVPPGSTFYPYVNCLACLGIINGYPDGTFKPNNQRDEGPAIQDRVQLCRLQRPADQPDVPGRARRLYLLRYTSAGWPLEATSTAIHAEVPESHASPATCPTSAPTTTPQEGRSARSTLTLPASTTRQVGQQFEDVAVGSTLLHLHLQAGQPRE